VLILFPWEVGREIKEGRGGRRGEKEDGRKNK
jgi:hypothetical protein